MNTVEGNKIIAEFMRFPKVTVGSLWHYDRSLDNASNTRNLEVVVVNERDVQFKQKMPYERYGLSYFDGVTFFPVDERQNKFHPNRRYHTSWDWLMPVCIKLGLEEVSTDINKTYQDAIKRILEARK